MPGTLAGFENVYYRITERSVQVIIYLLHLFLVKLRLMAYFSMFSKQPTYRTHVICKCLAPSLLLLSFTLWKSSAAVLNIKLCNNMAGFFFPSFYLFCPFGIVAESLWRRRRSRLFLGSCPGCWRICRPPYLRGGSRNLSSCSWQLSVSGARGMRVCRTLATRMWSGAEHGWWGRLANIING